MFLEDATSFVAEGDVPGGRSVFHKSDERKTRMERTDKPLMNYGMMKQQPEVAVFAYTIIDSNDTTQMRKFEYLFCPSRPFRLCTSLTMFIQPHKHANIDRGQANPEVNLRPKKRSTDVVCGAYNLHFSFLHDFLVRLDLVADLEIRPGLEAHAALGALAHFGDVFLNVFEGGESACQ